MQPGDMQPTEPTETSTAASYSTGLSKTDEMPGARHFLWRFTFGAAPQEIWPYIANTNHLNGAVGQPTIDLRPGRFALLGNGRMRLRFAVPLIAVEWEEQPFEWVYPQRYGVKRTYLRGPLAQMSVRLDLTPSPTGGSHLDYHVWVVPRGILGWLAVSIYIGLIIPRRVAKLLKTYDELATQHASPTLLPGPVRFAPGGHTRLMRLGEQLRANLQASGWSEQALALLPRLIALIETTEETSVSRLRPYELADAWGVRRRTLLELFLHAASMGLLDFKWELLCPLCRNSNDTSDHLGEINHAVHCPSCNIDYTVNFDRSVEVTFQPNRSIRAVQEYEFCVGGPTRTPHIIAQQVVPPGAEQTLTLSLEPGRYRLRTMAHSGGHHLQVATEGLSAARLLPEADEAEDELVLTPTPTLYLDNPGTAEEVFILERTAWSDQAVTAAEVTALQLFRSLFSSEALRPGERISVGRITIVFTDLRGSTRLYREIGDAPAFGRVMNHFDVLQAAVAAEGGALVKTIGDAVMAVFQRPVSALRAMLSAQQTLADPPEQANGMMPLRLKVGINMGACIAVTLNERLDYFGSTVNIAARLEGLSSGEDVIITNAVQTDPEVEALLAQYPAHLGAEPFTQTLKGFDTEVFDLWRVRLLAEGGPLPPALLQPD